MLLDVTSGKYLTVLWNFFSLKENLKTGSNPLLLFKKEVNEVPK